MLNTPPVICNMALALDDESPWRENHLHMDHFFPFGIAGFPPAPGYSELIVATGKGVASSQESPSNSWFYSSAEQTVTYCMRRRLLLEGTAVWGQPQQPEKEGWQ